MPRAHTWHLSFDKVVCRACGVRFSDGDGSECKGAAKIRPMATVTRQQVVEIVMTGKRYSFEEAFIDSAGYVDFTKPKGWKPDPAEDFRKKKLLKARWVHNVLSNLTKTIDAKDIAAWAASMDVLGLFNVAEPTDEQLMRLDRRVEGRVQMRKNIEAIRSSVMTPQDLPEATIGE